MGIAQKKNMYIYQTWVGNADLRACDSFYACVSGVRDSAQVCLLYGNRTTADVLLHEKLDAWARAHPRRFKLVCVRPARRPNPSTLT